MAKPKKIEKADLWKMKRNLTEKELDRQHFRISYMTPKQMKTRIKRITNVRKLLALMKVAGDWGKFGIRKAAKDRLFIVTGNSY